MTTTTITPGNLMATGPGTPWEDRGAGMIPAFFKTCIMGLKNPSDLWASMRRPETTGDARSFAIFCGICWGIGWVLNSCILFARIPDWQYGMIVKEGDVVAQVKFWNQFAILSLVQLILAPVALMILLNMATGMYMKLAEAEAKATAPPRSLIYNLLAYCLGPSLLAVIPFVGMVLAGIWITVLVIRAGSSRLCFRSRGSTTIALLVFLPVWGLVIGVYCAGWLINEQLDLLKCYTPAEVTKVQKPTV